MALSVCNFTGEGDTKFVDIQYKTRFFDHLEIKQQKVQ